MPAEISITQVKTTAQQSEFIKFIWKLYADSPQWVSPLLIQQREMLNREEHPFWKSKESRFLLAYRQGQLAGRAAFFYQRTAEAGPGHFGFLECVDDAAVFQALLNAGEAWLRAEGRTTVMGPFNPSLHYETGFLAEGFEQRPFFMMPYSKAYYPSMMEQSGYEKAKDFYAYYLPAKHWDEDGRIERAASQLSRQYPSLLVRHADGSRVKEELGAVWDLYNRSFEAHWGVEAMPREEFDVLGAGLKQVADLELVLVAEDKGQPIAFVLCVPNLNEALCKIKDGKLLPFGVLKLLWHRRKVRNVRVMTIGVAPAYQSKGIGTILFYELASRIIRKGYEGAEFSWVMEDNHRMRQAAEMMGARVQKVYRVYQKAL